MRRSWCSECLLSVGHVVLSGQRWLSACDADSCWPATRCASTRTRTWETVMARLRSSLVTRSTVCAEAPRAVRVKWSGRLLSESGSCRLRAFLTECLLSCLACCAHGANVCRESLCVYVIARTGCCRRWWGRVTPVDSNHMEEGDSGSRSARDMNSLSSCRAQPFSRFLSLSVSRAALSMGTAAHARTAARLTGRTGRCQRKARAALPRSAANKDANKWCSYNVLPVS